MLAVLVWLVTVQALAIAVLPLTCRVFRALPDRCYGFSKLIGLLLIGYLAWLSSMLGFTDFTRPPSTAIVLVVAVACWWIWGQECRVGLAARWRIVLLLETAFLLALGAAILVRAYNGDIVGQEKFMDFALMNAFLSAPDLPAEDPWLAGFGMPYYHFGYLLLGLPAKLSGTPGPVTYNLAVALVFANAFLGVTSIVYGLLARAEPREPGGVDTRALLFGFLGAAMAMLMGNLEGVLELVAAAGWGSGSFWQAVGVKGLGVGMGGATPPLDGAWWWRASRVIPNIQPDGITEFPYFSYLLGDLHPHYTAIPLDLAIVALAVAPWLDRREAESLPRTVVAAIVLGALIAANTWDVPTFFGLLLLAGALEAWRRSGSAADLRRRVAFALAPPVLAPLAVAPYFVGYESQRLGLGVVGERTPLASMLILFGPALIVTLALAGWMRLDKPNPLTPFPEGKGGPLELLPLPFREGGWGVRLAAGAALGALLLLQEPTLVMLGLVGMALGRRLRHSHEHRLQAPLRRLGPAGHRGRHRARAALVERARDLAAGHDLASRAGAWARPRLPARGDVDQIRPLSNRADSGRRTLPTSRQPLRSGCDRVASSKCRRPADRNRGGRPGLRVVRSGLDLLRPADYRRLGWPRAPVAGRAA